MKFNGQTGCRYIYHQYLIDLDRASFLIFLEFADRADRRVNFGDASPLNGNCPGHPGSSHGKKKSIDIDYYTFESNRTQYRKQTLGPLTPIWKDNELLAGVFDWERNYFFWRYLWRMDDSFRGSIDERIKKYMKSLIVKKYGVKAGAEFHRHIGGGAPGAYNHDTHIHCAWG